jgi:DNA ligase-associated metallophosphoesterase
MMIATKEIKINNQTFILTNQRAIFWKESKILILSDLHLGKTAHFRKNGIALPNQIIENDLDRLAKLLRHFETQKMMVVGDFIHAGKNSEFETFREWTTQFESLEISLIKGNHDRISHQNLTNIGVTSIHSNILDMEILFSHENVENTDSYVISGHIHPGVSLKTGIRKYLKLPCYIYTDKQLILPAFSQFTGLDTKNHPKNATYYCFSEEGIFECFA